jgi:two-component system, NarL family, response regulator YdfI
VTTVLVAARSASARARLEGLVAGSRALRLVSAPPGMALERQLHALRPDVVLLDLERDRVETALVGLREPTRAGFVVLVEDPRRALGTETLGRGLVRAVLPRDAASGEILAAIEAVAAGLIALHPDALGALPGRAPLPVRAEPAPAQPLTTREIEVLGMLAEGLGNKTIAARLGISTHTAKFHVASIMTKLGAGSRTEAVTIGMRRGLVVI